MTTEWLHDNVIIRSLMPTPGQIDQERLSGAWVTPDTPITATHDRVIVSARDRVTHVLTGAWEDPSHRWDIEDTEALRESGPDTVVGLYRDTLPYTCYDDALMEKYWMDPSSLDVFEHDRLFAGSVSPVTMQLADVNKHIEHELGAYWGVDVNDPARKNPVDVQYRGSPAAGLLPECEPTVLHSRRLGVR